MLTQRWRSAGACADTVVRGLYSHPPPHSAIISIKHLNSWQSTILFLVQNQRVRDLIKGGLTTAYALYFDTSLFCAERLPLWKQTQVVQVDHKLRTSLPGAARSASAVGKSSTVLRSCRSRSVPLRMLEPRRAGRSCQQATSWHNIRRQKAGQELA